MRFLNRLPLRIRLTVAFAGAAAVLLAAIGTFSLLRVESASTASSTTRCGCSPTPTRSTVR